jgi:hypothetical protein
MKIVNQEHIIEKISSVTVVNQLVETIFVDSSVGEIEIESVYKDADTIRKTHRVVKYRLDPHRLIVKSCKHSKSSVVISDSPRGNTIGENKCVCDMASVGVNQAFIFGLRNSKSLVRESISFFRQGIFRKVFNRTTESKLLDKMSLFGSDCSWMIVPNFIFEVIRLSDRFVPLECESDLLMRNCGKLGKINVYLNTQEIESVVYFGNYDSITVVVNRNVCFGETKSLSSVYGNNMVVTVEYQFIENGTLKMLTVD